MNTKRPNSRRNLDIAIRRFGLTDSDFVRNRTIIANAIVGNLMPEGVVKGGSAMKIRFGDECTRASTDLDAARRESIETFIGKLSESLSKGWCGFEGRVVKGKSATPKEVPTEYVMQPYEIKLSFNGTAWCTVPLELGHNEIGDADNPDYVIPKDANRMLSEMGFPELAAIPTLPLEFQIAQKIHAVSEPGSMRAHDLIDLQIIMAKSEVDLAQVKKTCLRLFAYRQVHEWPPSIVVEKGWSTLYEAQALPGLVLPTVEEAVAWANQLVAKINEAV